MIFIEQSTENRVEGIPALNLMKCSLFYLGSQCALNRDEGVPEYVHIFIWQKWCIKEGAQGDHAPALRLKYAIMAELRYTTS